MQKVKVGQRKIKIEKAGDKVKKLFERKIHVITLLRTLPSIYFCFVIISITSVVFYFQY